MTETTQSAANESFDEWSIVDVMGHQRYIGRTTEQVVAGCGFIRVDVPETEHTQAFTKLIGTSSIYAISPVSEAVARTMVSQRKQTPIASYDLPRLTEVMREVEVRDNDDDPEAF